MVGLNSVTLRKLGGGNPVRGGTPSGFTEKNGYPFTTFSDFSYYLFRLSWEVSWLFLVVLSSSKADGSNCKT